MSSAGTELHSTEVRQLSLDEKAYFDHLVQKAADLADKKIASREVRWRTLVTALVAVLAFFGFSRIDSTSNNVKNDVLLEVNKNIKSEFERQSESIDKSAEVLRSSMNNIVDTTVEEELNDRIGDILSKLELQETLIQFAFTSEEVNRSTSIDLRDKTFLLEKFNFLIENLDSPGSNRFFISAVEKMIAAISATAVVSDMDFIEEKLAKYNVSSGFFDHAFYVHYTIQYLRSADRPVKVLERFEKYSSRAKSTVSESLTDLYDAVVSFARARSAKNQLTDVQIESIYQYAVVAESGKVKKEYIVLLLENLDLLMRNFTPPDDSAEEIAADTIRKFLESYAQQIDLLSSALGYTTFDEFRSALSKINGL
jgi:hypothetical protein